MKTTFFYLVSIFLSFNPLFSSAAPQDIYTAARSYERADIELNLKYLDLMNAMDSLKSMTTDQDYYTELKRRIVFNQRSWLTFRDSHCELSALREGNTRAVLFYEIDCMYRQTRERIVYIQSLNKMIMSDIPVNLGTLH